MLLSSFGVDINVGVGLGVGVGVGVSIQCFYSVLMLVLIYDI